MELVAKATASVRTTEMLLDTCMQGFLHKLFLEKWHRFGSRIHYARRLADALILILLLSLGFGLKESPRDYGGTVATPVFLILFMLAATAQELYVALLFLRNERDTPLEPGEAQLSTSRLLIVTWRWCSLHATDWEFLSHLLIFIACCIVFVSIVRFSHCCQSRPS